VWLLARLVVAAYLVQVATVVYSSVNELANHRLSDEEADADLQACTARHTRFAAPETRYT